ncbi:hypothetical protein [Pedobacter sp. Hv1]|uniref:hypothetical protein n=1 Tax=Pedobacter sp. Hv1 TaxID=1740090 RepID=UPI00128ED5B4|nr:hypothetical protein [Pedobacter sp. Hv1]
MKKSYKILLFLVAIIAFVIVNHTVQAKNSYFLLDTKSDAYSVNRVTLSAKQLYNLPVEVELYNLHYKDRLLLFSVLPAKVKWVEIDENELKSGLIDFKALDQLFERSLQASLKAEYSNTDRIKREDIKIVLAKNGKYLAANFCISEYFVIANNPLLFPNQMGEAFINIKSPILNVKDFEILFKQTFKKNSPNAIGDPDHHMMSYPFFVKPLNFLSGTTTILAKKAYRFWHYSDWRVMDGYNTQRGAERFLYVPELGIVAGSYDFWFAKQVNSLVYEKFMDNYLAERMMYPTSMNGVPVAIQ